MPRLVACNPTYLTSSNKALQELKDNIQGKKKLEKSIHITSIKLKYRASSIVFSVKLL